MTVVNLSPRKLHGKFGRAHRLLYELEQELQPSAVAAPNDRYKRDVVTRALLALRKATAEERVEIVRQFGAEDLWLALSKTLGPDHNSSTNGAADHPNLSDR